VTKKLEREVQHEIMEALGAEPDLILFRNSVGRATVFSSDSGKPQVVTYGLGVGSADLVGILRIEVNGRAFGRWFALELKRPGEKPRPEQIACHRIWRAQGAFVGVATSVAEARVCLERARNGESE
jgi:hypothetical protein